MKNTLAIAAVLLMFFSSCQKDLVVPEEQDSLQGEGVASDATNDVAETSPAIHTPITTYVNGNCAGYYESLPARYHSTTKKYPLILFIHGIGELGTGVTRLNCCGLPRHLNRKEFPAQFTVNGQTFSFIVVSPQFKNRPSAWDVQSVIDYAKKKYRIDETRIYVTGLSMGGGSTFDYSAVYGQNAAAIVPVCAGTKPTSSLAKSVASKNLPVWTISSTRDEAVPIQWAKDWISWIDQANSSIAPYTKLTVWTNESHNDTWYRAFNPGTRVDGKSIYEWMLQFKRGSGSPSPEPAPAPTPSSGNQAPIARAGQDFAANLSWGNRALLNGTLSSDPDGWLKTATWSKISGPSGGGISVKSWGEAYATNLVSGTYVFRLTVTDNDGKSSTDDVTVYANSSGRIQPSSGSSGSGSSSSGNQAPVAKAGSDQTIPLSWNYAPLINATTSYDSDGWVKSFRWAKWNGPACTISDSNAGKTKIYNMQKGEYTFRVAVTDNEGAVSHDYVNITVR